MLTPTGGVVEHLAEKLQVYHTEMTNTKIEAKVAKRVTVPSQTCMSIKVSIPKISGREGDVHFLGRNCIEKDTDWELPSQVSKVTTGTDGHDFSFVVIYNAAEKELILDKGFPLCEIEDIIEQPMVNFIRTKKRDKQPCGTWTSTEGVERESDEDFSTPPDKVQIW